MNLNFENDVARIHKSVDDLYDKAEGISAKIKIWVRLNKVRMAIDAGCFLLGLLIGFAL